MIIASMICTKHCSRCWGCSANVDVVFPGNVIGGTEKYAGLVVKEEGESALGAPRGAPSPALAGVGGVLLRRGVINGELKGEEELVRQRKKLLRNQTIVGSISCKTL